MKIIRKILFFIICLIAILISIVFYSGYQVYQTTLNNTKIEAKVEELKKNKNYVELKKLPKEYKDAIVSVEDRRYYNHGPIDFIATCRAIYVNITNFEFREGGSTITQQVAKNLYFMSSNENFIIRKVAEALIAYDLEDKYNKDEILELYVNTIYFGEGYYGIKQACNGYFKKEPENMNLFESTMMAGIPNAPSVYAPTINLELTLNRQRKVITTMVENKYINQEKADELIKKQSKFKLDNY